MSIDVELTSDDMQKIESKLSQIQFREKDYPKNYWSGQIRNKIINIKQLKQTC